jgi:ABC-type Fe3+/spermidine/putrescine transport system ATPase subunit
VKAEELRLKMTLKDNEGLKKEQFKRSQRLFELRTRERELISDISGGQGQNKNLAVRITQLDEQVRHFRLADTLNSASVSWMCR